MLQINRTIPVTRTIMETAAIAQYSPETFDMLMSLPLVSFASAFKYFSYGSLLIIFRYSHNGSINSDESLDATIPVK